MASALSAPNISLPIADHNAPLPGDELFGLQLNYQWRRVLVHLAENMMDRRIYDGTEIEIDTAIQQVHALLSDMYAIEVSMAYHGALVARSTNQTISGATQVIFDTTVNNGNHDTDSYWSAPSPVNLQVPAGLGGYYRVYAYLQFGADVDLIAMELRRFGSSFLVFDRDFSHDLGNHVVRMNAPVVLADLDWVDCVVNMGAGSRDLIVGGHPYSARFGLYRLGDAP